MNPIRGATARGNENTPSNTAASNGHLSLGACSSLPLASVTRTQNEEADEERYVRTSLLY